MTRNIKVLFKTKDLCIPDIGSIQKGAQEQQRQYRKDPAGG